MAAAVACASLDVSRWGLTGADGERPENRQVSGQCENL